MSTEPERSIAELLSVAWLWVCMLLGGMVDYIILAQRGLRPSKPWGTVAMAVGTHLTVACFAGVLGVLLAEAAGLSSETQLGAASGMCGYLGVRLFDVFSVIIKLRTGLDINPSAK